MLALPGPYSLPEVLPGANALLGVEDPDPCGDPLALLCGDSATGCPVLCSTSCAFPLWSMVATLMATCVSGAWSSSALTLGPLGALGALIVASSAIAPAPLVRGLLGS